MNAWAIRPVIDRRRWHRWFWDGLSRGKIVVRRRWMGWRQTLGESGGAGSVLQEIGVARPYSDHGPWWSGIVCRSLEEPRVDWDSDGVMLGYEE